MKYALILGSRICQFVATAGERFPVAPELRWVEVADDVSERERFLNGVIVSYVEPPAAVPPTNDEIFDMVMLRDRVFRAAMSAINKGTFAPGANKTAAQLKAIIKVEM